LYEKIHFLGEDVDGKNDEDDDYDDFKHRRRYNPAKITCFTPTPTVAALTQPVHITGNTKKKSIAFLALFICSFVGTKIYFHNYNYFYALNSFMEFDGMGSEFSSWGQGHPMTFVNQ